MGTQNELTWVDPTGHEWIVPPFTTKLSPWKKKKHKAIADFVRSRAGNRCEECGATWKRDHAIIVIDHIIPRRVGGTNHPDNLQLLCDSCHGRKTGQEMLQWPPLQFPTLKEQSRIRAKKMWEGVS